MAEGDSYGTLLVFIVVTYAAIAIVENHIWSRAVLAGCFGATLVLALHTSHVRGRVIRVVSVLVAVTIAANVLFAVLGEPVRGASFVLIVLVVAAPMVVLTRILRHPVVNVETVLGAIDAYLLIGMLFAVLYSMIDNVGTEHFFAQGAANGVQFLYFSFVVLTTLGFGDLSPATDAGRIIVTIEALLGQLFLVTVLALIVANLGRARLQVQTRPDASPAPGRDAPPDDD
jgi:hypothetical protein